MRIAVLTFALVACQTSAPVEPAKPPTQTGSAATKPPDDAVTCETTADCDRHPCGPCAKGDVLTTHDVSIKCFRNPCPDSTVSCQNKVCTVD